MSEFLEYKDLISEVEISILASVFAMLYATFSAFIIRFLYISFGRSLNNREYFANTFLILSITTCSVIIIVKYSLALSLGLVGALSIVRFRAAIKEPEELVYLFLVIALGLSFGANQVLIGFLLLLTASVIIISSSIFMDKKKNKDYLGMVIIISGEKRMIANFRKSKLTPMMNDYDYIILKELEYSENFGRLVLKSSINNDLKSLIDKLERVSEESNLDLNIISDISVPA